jgi:hypothetical protein
VFIPLCATSRTTKRRSKRRLVVVHLNSARKGGCNELPLTSCYYPWVQHALLNYGTAFEMHMGVGYGQREMNLRGAVFQFTLPSTN